MIIKEKLKQIQDNPGLIDLVFLNRGFTLPNLSELQFVWISDEQDYESLLPKNIKVERSPNLGKNLILLPKQDLKISKQFRINFQGDNNILILGKGTEINGFIEFRSHRGLAIFSDNNKHPGFCNCRLVGSDELIFFGYGATSFGVTCVAHEKDSKIIIGDDCMFASNIWIRNSDMHAIFDLSTQNRINFSQNVLIQPHVWLGQDVLLLKNAKIGVGSIIAARAVVTNDIPDFSLAGGVPAKVIKNNVSWDRNLWVADETLNLISSYQNVEALNESLEVHQLVNNSEPEEKIYSQIWENLNQPNLGKFDTEKSNYPTNINQANVERYFNDSVKYKVLKLGEATPEEKLFLEQNKLSVSLLRLLHHQDDLKQQKSYLFDWNQESELNIESIEKLDIDQDTAFQQVLVDLGYLYTICPFSGKTIRSNQSFFWGNFIGIYRCVGEQVFYLIMAQESFRKIFAYFPNLELIINLSSSYIDPVQLINKWRSYVVANRQKVTDYINFKQDQRLKVNILGFRESVAHYCYNELAGVDLLRQTDRLDKIDKFIVGSNTYFGSLEDLFPEIPQENIVKISSKKEKMNLHEQLLEQQYLAFKYCNRKEILSEELAQRVYNAAQKNCSRSTGSQIEEAKQHFPLIWIDIRVHKRAWISQVEGITNLLIELSQDYPNLGVVFQGMALPEGVDLEDDLSWQHKQKMIEKDQEVVEQIIAGISQEEIAVFNGIGCMMYESIVWANTVDFYIAPWGAGLTRLTLIANKPGIIHTNHYTLESNIIKNWFNESQRENGVSPIFISSNFITVLPGSGGGELHDDSYECDWRSIYEEAVGLIENMNNKK